MICHDQHLLSTLEELGFSALDWEGSHSDVLHCAVPESASMAETYQFVNDLLESSRTRSGMRIRHVTGEAMALLDPAHRRVLRRAAAHGDRGQLLCSFDFESEPTALEFLSRQHTHWDF